MQQVWLIVPIIIIIAALYLLITPFWQEPVESSLALIFIALGIPDICLFGGTKPDMPATDFVVSVKKQSV